MFLLAGNTLVINGKIDGKKRGMTEDEMVGWYH